MKTIGKLLSNWRYLSVCFIIINAQWLYAKQDSASLLDNDYFHNSYFILEGDVSQSCIESLVNALSELPQEIKNYLVKEINRRGKKYVFKKVSFEESSNETFSRTVYGTPIFYADSHTIYHNTNWCPFVNRTIIHEIGHLVHASIRINQPVLYKTWIILWRDVFQKHGSPKNPFEFNFRSSNLPFIGWKDADNYSEGFAQLIMLSVPSIMEIYQNNTHPDFLRKVDFLKNTIMQ